jgi:hypothetical protein
MDTRQIEMVRNRAMHSLNPTTATYGGMTVAHLQQFVAGAVHPTDEQLANLARHFNIKEKV